MGYELFMLYWCNIDAILSHMVVSIVMGIPKNRCLCEGLKMDDLGVPKS